MKRILVLTIYILLVIISLQAQGTRKFTESQKQAFEKQFIDKSRSISTLQSAFIQTKTSTMVSQSAVSKGNMYYRNPSMLIWEYTSPSKSSLIVDGRSTRLLDENGNIVGNKNVSKQLGCRQQTVYYRNIRDSQQSDTCSADSSAAEIKRFLQHNKN